MMSQIESNDQGILRDGRISHVSLLLIIAVLMVLLCLIASIFESSGSFESNSFFVIGTFAINGFMGIVFLCRSIAARSFSLVQMHWIFYITMFVIAPCSQFLNGYSAWGYSLTISDYLVTNVALTVWGMLFAIFSIDHSGNAAYRQKVFFSSLVKIDARAEMIALIVSLIATAIVIAFVGFENLFSRATFSTDLDKTMGLLFDKAIRPLPVFAFVLVLARCKQRGRFSPILLASFALMLIACFPTGMARYNMACIYGGILLLIIVSLFEKKGLFALLFLLAFLIVFPASNSYRWQAFTFSMFGDALLEAAGNLSRGFCAVDYDAYSMVARTIKYVGSHGATDGYQLLGVLFFFVPRALWPSKPEGSGNLVCVAQGQTQLNISSPLPAEGLINFGIIGIILFAVGAALICRSVDRWFISSRTPIRLFYPFACLLMFFIMRGDLLSSFAFTVGYFVSFSTLCIACLGFRALLGNREKGDARYV